MTIGFNTFLVAVSTILDYAEQEVMPISTHHTKRCAYIAVRLAEELGMGEAERSDLCTLALMHDNGITQAFCDPVQMPERIMNLEAFKEHTVIGEKNIREFPFNTDVRQVLLYHHEHLDGSGLHGLSGDEIPLMSQLICFAETIDTQFNLSEGSYTELVRLRECASANCTIRFQNEIVRAFLRLSYQATFWEDLKDANISNALQAHMPTKEGIGLQEMLEMTTVICKIVELKYNGISMGIDMLMDKARRMAEYYGFEDDHAVKFQIAANLHGIGKLLAMTRGQKGRIIDSFGDRDGTLNRHVDSTYLVMKSMEGFEEMQRWAAFHHDRSGILHSIGAKKMPECFEAVLLAALDIYEVLLNEGRFHGDTSHDVAIATMIQHAKHGYLSAKMVRDIDMVFADEYHEMSMMHGA